MDQTTEVSANVQSIQVAYGYTVNSNESVEQEDCGLVSGTSLVVKDADGQVVYEGLRAFLPLNDKMNLVRFADKVWMLVYINKGKDKDDEQVRLNRVNLHLQGDVHCLLFDERGKMHRDQVSPHYRDIMA